VTGSEIWERWDVIERQKNKKDCGKTELDGI
jgi:hypothetical protein